VVTGAGGAAGPYALPTMANTTLATSKIASHINQLASSLTMIVRFTAPHDQLLRPGAEPRKWHHAKVVLDMIHATLGQA
jgi:hypothetical protein